MYHDKQSCNPTFSLPLPIFLSKPTEIISVQWFGLCNIDHILLSCIKRKNVCVCMYKRERERERERWIQTEKEKRQAGRETLR